MDTIEPLPLAKPVNVYHAADENEREDEQADDGDHMVRNRFGRPRNKCLRR